MTTGYAFKPEIYRFTPTTGGSITIPSTVTDTTVVISPATDIAAVTLVWPTTPYDGQTVRVLSTKNIAAVTHSGGTLNRATAGFPAAGDMTFVYDASGGAWMCTGMTVSTVVSLPFTGTVAGGAGDCVFYATDNGLVGGNALFSSIQHVQPMLDVADPNNAFAKPVVSNGNKTITTNVKRLSFTSTNVLINLLGALTSVLTGFTLGSAPNGTALTFIVHGTLA